MESNKQSLIFIQEGILVNQDLIELIGIILGDGNIQVYPEIWRYRLTITLNGIDESRYVEYVKLLLTRVFRQEPNIDNTIKGKGLLLAYYRKDIVESLINLGLVPGSKSLHQVGVPDIVLENLNFYKFCLKGLFDTDGSIEINKNKNFILSFSNISAPLVSDFYKMCIKLNIIPSPTIYQKKKRDGSIEHTTNIAKKDEVKKFLALIKPEKFKDPFRRIWIAAKCLIFDTKDDNRRYINNRISSKKSEIGRKKFQFSKKNTLFLKSLCNEVLDKDLDEDLVNSIISKAVEPIKFMYNKERAKKLKYLYEKIRSPTRIVKYLTDQGELIIPTRTTISNHIKKYFKEIGKDINIWKKEFPSISIYYDKTFTKIVRFSVEKRNLLIEMIIDILKNNETKISDSNLIKEVEKRLIKYDFLLLKWLLCSPNYGKAFKRYLKSLIDLMRQLVIISINYLELNISGIKSDISYVNLKDIIRFIRKNEFLEFEISPRSRLRVI